MFNYANLSDVEFEYLCQDILQCKLNTELRRFASGKDGGIDLTDNVHTKNIVVQVKHYMASPASSLINALKKEISKVKTFSPKEYYVCCSKELSPQKVDEIYQMFSAYMSSPSNVFTLTEIDDFLSDSANVEILKKHYKLWIESTGVLQELGNTSVFIDCETLLADIEDDKKLFVETSAYKAALKCLQDDRTLFITGNPGVGKTVTSKMLVLHYAAMGYRVRFSTNVSNLAELKQSLSRDPEVKEIILVDDCFGQAYFNMKESQSDELLSLIHFVNASPNKLLILNSRITILQEAKGRKPELLKCFEGKKVKVFVLDMSAIDDVEKAKIFYNHIFFSGMDASYFAEIKRDHRYYNIIRHANYTPRIIEFICNPSRYKDVSPAQYYKFAMQQLDNPREIWKDEYEHRLRKSDRLLLLTLYSLSDSAVSEELVRECFERRLSMESDIDITISQYEASLTRLLDGFVKIVSSGSSRKLAMINPSVNDYIDGRLEKSSCEKEQLIAQAVSIQQKKRLMSEPDFEGFVQSALKNQEIDRYLFDNGRQKGAFISYYCSKYVILDALYTDDIHSFLNAPYYLRIYETVPIAPIQTIRQLLQEDFCTYYKLGEYLNTDCNLENMLGSFDLNDLIELIRLIDRFFSDDTRENFICIAAGELKNAIQAHCEDLDADDFDPDVDSALESSQYFNGIYYDVDTENAESKVYESIISDVEDEIESLLSTLPEDIQNYCNYTFGLVFSVNGISELVRSYLADDYDYDDYRQDPASSDGFNAEIDFMFNR